MVRFCWIGMLLGLLLALPTMAAEKAKTVSNMTITHTTPLLHIEVQYPELGIRSVDEDIAEWARQMVETFKQDYAETERPEGAPDTPYALNVEYTVLRPSASALSLVWEVSDYTGGAHGNLYISTVNYAMPKGQVLELENVFGEPEQAVDIFSTVCRQQLAAVLGDMRVEDMLKEGTEPKAENFANMALTPTGVRIYFSPYEVAPWAAGPQQVDIALDLLRKAGPQLALWGK